MHESWTAKAAARRRPRCFGAEVVETSNHSYIQYVRSSSCEKTCMLEVSGDGKSLSARGLASVGLVRCSERSHSNARRMLCRFSLSVTSRNPAEPVNATAHITHPQRYVSLSVQSTARPEEAKSSTSAYGKSQACPRNLKVAVLSIGRERESLRPRGACLPTVREVGFTMLRSTRPQRGGKRPH